jgi:putative transposase
MTNIRRFFRENDTIFVTHVTYNRLPILIDNFELLWKAIESTKKKNEFVVVAWVVLPDHFHMIVEPNKNNLSDLMKSMKLTFSAHYRKRTGIRRGRVWQNRFWDHIIRDQVDLNKHIDYIHYNAVKHRLIANATDWKFSSISQYYKEGYYSKDRGSIGHLSFEGEFGE